MPVEWLADLVGVLNEEIALHVFVVLSLLASLGGALLSLLDVSVGGSGELIGIWWLVSVGFCIAQ